MKTHQQTKKMAEGALMIAFATVLGIFPLAQLPYGGSVTVASMLPIVLISYRHGIKWGMGAGFIFGVIQQLLGLSNLSYFTTWQSIVAIVLLDYLVAFSVVGIAGVFRRFSFLQRDALLLGSLFGSILRYLCHVISGATVWAGLSIPTEAALAYSLAYNATYMVPEAIVLCIASYYLGSMLDFGKEEITRLPTVQTASRGANILVALAGLVGGGALVFDTVMIFSRMQDAETGEFNISLLQVERFAGSFWMAVVIVTGVAVLAVGVMLAVRRWLLKRVPKMPNT
ncbi:MAG: energy-coupled thiamine transporter ThiT [Clostridia bacterium]|nr:energy-coupled thiamine transporter ThiT [Clostridia bacterium]